jgi:uncharacterized protein with GYD domain
MLRILHDNEVPGVKQAVNTTTRPATARQSIESVGGTVHGCWYAFAEHEGSHLWEAPDHGSMAAVAIAIGGGRARNRH